MMELNVKTAEKELERAEKLNPGDWVAHSRFVALACRNIAACCPGLSPDEAYCFGLLHDIGRYAGRSSEKHLIDGYEKSADRFMTFSRELLKTVFSRRENNSLRTGIPAQ